MADIYVRSTDGSDSDNGSTWALAKATLAGAVAICSPGDTIWLSQNHSETTAGAVSWSINSSAASPVRVLCGNDGAEPPTALATSAVIATSGGSAGTMTITAPSGGGVVYFYGVTFKPNASSTTGLLLANTFTHRTILEDCVIDFSATSLSCTASNGGTGSIVTLINVVFKTGAANQHIVCNGAGAQMNFIGGAYQSGSSISTMFFGGLAPNGFQLNVSGFDWSAAPSTIDVFDFAIAGGSYQLKLDACKFPASWSGDVVGAAWQRDGLKFWLTNCTAQDTNYQIVYGELRGTIVDETSLVRTGGANDGTTSISWKATTTSDTDFPFGVFEMPKILRWNETTGSAITVTVEILHDPGSPGSLNDDEIWLEVMYLGTSGVPLGSFVDDAKADVLASAAPQASSSASWTTTGMSNPTTQKLSVTFTPQEKGFIHATVKMAKPSYTVYVCPKLEIS